jgi:hypothetical protein
MQKHHLEKQIADAAAVVTDWKNTIANIETQFHAANLALANAKKVREAYALKAAMGDADAVASVKHARGEQHSAEQTVADLKVALPEAEAQLAAAVKAMAFAQHELSRFEAECLAQERVRVAARIDVLITEFSNVFSDYDRLGSEIANMPGLLPTNPLAVGSSISRMEEIEGNRRIRAALPKVFLRFYPGALHSERPSMTLEASEIQIWSSLASIETTTPKAA